jgi:NADH-quinone oxidoreductase subunit F
MGLPVPYVTGYLTQHFGDDAFGSVDGYVARGGYEAARQAITRMTPSEVIELVKDAGLQGRGGAGFSTGLKWSFMPTDGARPSYLVCNADESEPGSFKDRILLERGPHQLLEGILIAAWATGARTTFAGLLESLEGKKGQPRKKPPFPAELGAFGMPTTVNNVETFCHVPHIVRGGASWFRGIGTEKSPGTTLFGVSGHVTRPGLYELPLGTRLDEIVFEHAGGVPAGRKLKGVIPGGLSMPVLPADQLDVPMAHAELALRGTALGTGGIIVMDETTCMVRAGCVISWFFRDESCGQCTQCREGTSWIHKLLERIERGAGGAEDIAILGDVAAKMEGGTICAFADAAAWPVQGLLRHFREDFDAHVRLGKCPFPESFAL